MPTSAPKATAPTPRSRTVKPTAAAELALRLHALLHTVRSISHIEDELCTLLHAAEHASALTPALTGELRALLQKMPAQEYTDDLDAVRALVGKASPARNANSKAASKAKSKTKPNTARKPARKPAARKTAVGKSTTSPTVRTKARKAKF